MCVGLCVCVGKSRCACMCICVGVYRFVCMCEYACVRSIWRPACHSALSLLRDVSPNGHIASLHLSSRAAWMLFILHLFIIYICIYKCVYIYICIFKCICIRYQDMAELR